MAKLFKITKGSFSRKEDGKFVRYSNREGGHSSIELDQKSYESLKDHLGLVPLSLSAKAETSDVEVPDDWKKLSAADMKDLAEKIDGEKITNKAAAEAIIEGYLESKKGAGE